MTSKEYIGIGAGLIVGTASAVLFLYANFTTQVTHASDLSDVDKELIEHEADHKQEITALSLQIAYDAYYARLDDYEETVAEGRTDLAAEYMRQMERIKATICEEDPEWERCD